MSELGMVLILIVAGFASSLIWLLFYLGQDVHPEPKKLVIKTFLLGIVLAPLAVAAQYVFIKALGSDYDSSNSLLFFLFAAGIEEYVKFLVVRQLILKNPEFDEPVDAMIYMIIAALGFAAIENILVLFRTMSQNGLDAGSYLGLFHVWILRFFGATLLHVLSSAILGYFLGLSWFFHRHSKKLVGLGLGIATLFHFTFNIVLVRTDNPDTGLYASSFVILLMIALTSVLFNQIKKRRVMQVKNESHPQLYPLEKF